MILSDDILYRIKDIAEEVEYGSIEIRLDNNTSYIDIIKTDRIRVKRYSSTERLTNKT